MGELARQPGAPKLPETPMEALTARPGEGYSLLDKFLYPVSFSFLTTVSYLIYNRMGKRPLYSGLHLNVLIGAGAWYLGDLFKESRFEARAEKDAVLRHYISLHPELFPPFERKRVKDMFVDWYPAR